MPSTQFESKQYDTGNSPEMTFTPPTNITWTLQDAGTTVKFIMRLPFSSAPKIEATAVVTGPWTVRYDPIAADVNALGTYDVEVEVHRSNLKQLTLPTRGYLTWLIGPDLNGR